MLRVAHATMGHRSRLTLFYEWSSAAHHRSRTHNGRRRLQPQHVLPQNPRALPAHRQLLSRHERYEIAAAGHRRDSLHHREIRESAARETHKHRRLEPRLDVLETL